MAAPPCPAPTPRSWVMGGRPQHHPCMQLAFLPSTAASSFSFQSCPGVERVLQPHRGSPFPRPVCSWMPACACGSEREPACLPLTVGRAPKSPPCLTLIPDAWPWDGHVRGAQSRLTESRNEWHMSKWSWPCSVKTLKASHQSHIYSLVTRSGLCTRHNLEA